MNHNLEARIEALEKDVLELRSYSLYQGRAAASLLAVIERVAELHGPRTAAKSEDIRPAYEETLRREMEKLLATISDDNPTLATQLRDILKEELDKTH
jgi:hypothetical protein